MSNIRLKSIAYREREGRPLQWFLDELTLGPVNLLVGKNASGKTRVLNIIGNLAQHFLRDQLGVQETGFKAVFDSDGQELQYSLDVKEGNVIREQVVVNGEKKLTRDNEKLEIFAEKIGEFIEFAPSHKEVAAVARCDKLQHPFLLPLHEWAKSVRHYHFGGMLGKEHMAFLVKSGQESLVTDDRDENKVVSIFLKGKQELGKKYVNAVIADMKKLGYDVDTIDTGAPHNVSVSLGTPQGTPTIPLQGQLQAIGIREKGVPGMFYQDAISQGMFRALSILTQVNYSQMTSRASCVLIDDIGEGLDFVRSSLLIELLRKKAQSFSFQLIMSTNDQFVMNHVPLEEWSVLQRNGSHVSVRNIHNSREVFEEFRFVGMSNFSFFELDFLNGGPEEEDVTQDE